MALLLLLLAYVGASRAALGGEPEQFAPQITTVLSGVSSAGASYFTRDTTLAAGTRVREYVSDSGIVFAVTWEGPMLPDLKKNSDERALFELVPLQDKTGCGARKKDDCYPCLRTSNDLDDAISAVRTRKR